MISEKVVRTAAPLLASASGVTTDWVLCLGADEVAWFLRATDTDQLTTVVVEISEDATNPIAASATLLVTALVTGAQAVAMNVTPGLVFAHCSQVSRRFPWKYARLNLTNGAAQIDGLAITARVFTDDAFDEPATNRPGD